MPMGQVVALSISHLDSSTYANIVCVCMDVTTNAQVLTGILKPGNYVVRDEPLPEPPEWVPLSPFPFFSGSSLVFRLSQYYVRGITHEPVALGISVGFRQVHVIENYLPAGKDVHTTCEARRRILSLFRYQSKPDLVVMSWS